MRLQIHLLLSLAIVLSTIGLCGTASAGLVGHWTFDETTGAVADDSSGQNNDGTVVGNAKWVPGKLGGALEFDGNTYVDCGNNPSLNVRDQISISFWFKVEMFQNGWEAFLAKGDGAYRVSRSAETGNATHMGITGSNYFDAVTVVTDNAWHHWCGTYDGTDAKIYLDGKLDAARTYGGQIGDSSGYNLYIGNNSQQTGRRLHGLMDDVRIYDKALNEQQLHDLIGGGVSPAWNKAEKPDPVDGALTVGAPLFRWARGESAMFHDVYLGTSPELTEADRVATHLLQAATVYYHIPGLTPGATYYWRVDEIEMDGVTTHTGDVWTFVAQAMTAYRPSPADADNTASPTPTVTWLPGAGAIQHRLYFGDDANAVTEGSAGTDQGAFALADTAFKPGDIETLKTYFWRVDEVFPGDTVRTGAVWSFTTAVVIDDFESYTDDEGSRIYETWVDGATDDSNGSMVGYLRAPFAELVIVHDANQSMPLDYNNVDAPFYSEAVREFAPAQDWTAGGADTLVLYVRGRLINDRTPLYVRIEDSAKKTGAVVYPDAAVVTANKWIEWKIPFSELAAAGVDMARVKKMVIGVGDTADPKAGGKGLIYIDDIRITRP